MSKKKKDVVPADPAQRAPAAATSAPASLPSFNLSRGKSPTAAAAARPAVGFSSTTDSAAGPAVALPPVAAAAAARTPAAPFGPEIAPTTATDDVLRAAPPPAPAPPSAPTPPAPPPAAATPPATAFSPTSHAWASAAPTPEEDVRTKQAREWQERTEQRNEFSRRKLSEQMPQGETKLVHVWASRISEGVPANACTIWVTRTEPADNTYELMIPGEAVGGLQPDRALFAYMTRQRRQAGVAESFVGRIQGALVDGKLVPLGHGTIHLPPDPAVNAGNAAASGTGPWVMAPGNGWTPPNGAGAPPGWGMPPWGGPPPWLPPNFHQQWYASMMSGGAPWMMPGGMSPPWWGASPAQQPPDALKNKPDLLALWEIMVKNQNPQQPPNPLQDRLTTLLIEKAFKDPTPPPAPPSMREQLEGFGALATALDTIRGPQQAPSKGIEIHYVDDGSGGKQPIVTRDGEIDMGVSVGLPAVGAIKSVVGAVKTRMAATGAVARGQSPTKPAAQVPATTTNGTSGGGTGAH